MTVVLDASVFLKWLLEDPTTEPDNQKALALIEAVVRPECLTTGDETRNRDRSPPI